MPQISPHETPARFQVALATLVFDRFMNHFIKIGGIAVVGAVLGIFVFIGAQIIPLFQGARVNRTRTVALGVDKEFVAMGSDEWTELPFFVDRKGSIYFQDLVEGDFNRGFFKKDSGLPAGLDYSAAFYSGRGRDLVLGTRDGKFSIIRIDYKDSFPKDRAREIVADISASPLLNIGIPGKPVEKIGYGDNGARKIVAAIQRVEGKPRLHAVTLAQKRTLFGVGEVRVENAYDLTPMIEGEPTHLLVRWEADSILAARENGDVSFIFFDDGEFSLRQVFRPFGDLAEASIASMDFIFGDVSVAFTSKSGESRVFSLYRDPEKNARIWGHSKTFPDLPSGAGFYAASLRNKAFLTGHQNFASLRYSTTEDVRWEEELPFNVRRAVIAPRYNNLLFLDDDNNLHVYKLDDPHPVSGWKTYFGKIQYEGQAEKEYVWQSTGGSDDFEKKLSMVPLIIGTLKGTFYAMIFALPIAILAALYTSQFLRPDIKRFIKPAMEIMASLPSVVLGFLAALWLAPVVSNNVPSVLLAVACVVGGSFLAGWLWWKIPVKTRSLVKPGYEFLLFLPVMFLFAWIGWRLGPVLESWFFVVVDPDTGRRVADFRLWYPKATGLGFEQRNAFVIGFVMGFAVIPVIFTIAEDSLSNVPESFRSASLALGSSRWQTATRVVLPTASAGIFSAVMIGFGRAVGETMIVVMAAGNTPVTDFNIFTGMRTLSANIAVELPEAPYLGTLYRTLFLGAMVLFLMTFFVNTLAELMRQYLRDKYRAVE